MWLNSTTPIVAWCATHQPSLMGGRLDVLQVGKVSRKKRRVAVHNMTVATMEALTTQLEAERADYISENPSLLIIGPQLVCPDSTISAISSNAKFISIPSDMNCFCLRQEIRQRFFNVVITILNNS